MFATYAELVIGPGLAMPGACVEIDLVMNHHLFFIEGRRRRRCDVFWKPRNTDCI